MSLVALEDLCTMRVGVGKIHPDGANVRHLRKSSVTGLGLNWGSHSWGGSQTPFYLKPGDVLLHGSVFRKDCSTEAVRLDLVGGPLPFAASFTLDLILLRPVASVEPVRLLLALRDALPTLAPAVRALSSSVDRLRALGAQLLDLDRYLQDHVAAVKQYYQDHDELVAKGFALLGR